jgi:TonB family protein
VIQHPQIALVLRRSLSSIPALVLAVGCAMSPRSTTPATADALVAAAMCLDSLHAADSIAVIVKMSVNPQDTAVRLAPDFEGLFVEEFRSRFKAPPNLPLSVVVGSPPCDSLGSRCAGASLNVAAVAYATAHSDGKLSDIEVLDASLTPALDDSIKVALQAMSKDAVAPLSGDVEPVPLIMEIGPEENLDTAAAERRIFRTKLPHYDIPFRYASMPVAGIDARFPFSARVAGIGDSVTIAFTVDAAGNIATESVQLVRATYGDFVSSAVNAIARTRFHPAYLGDCPVATRVTQRFLFNEPQ